MPTLPFTVDAALLRELGERLVGQPHIALAELVKNAYDADATVVEVEVGPDFIVVSDNGHGMTLKEFRDYFMRIGSPHKERARLSWKLKRPLTGSKGVGRLAVQFLAADLDLATAPTRGETLTATVDWRQAVRAEELTKAEVEYHTSRARPKRFPGGMTHGTAIRLRALRHQWSAEDFEQLAREIWALQPPFQHPGTNSGDFRVQLKAEDEDLVSTFDDQMRAWLHLWHAKLVGQPHDAQPRGDALRMALRVQFEGEDEGLLEYTVPDCPLQDVSFEIRVFSLAHRQRFGIPVGSAREYLQENGGVHIYDSSFHLPYYGPATDWLGVEVAHSHRLSTSKLLPMELQVRDGLNFLPTNTRLFGVVNVNTSEERRGVVQTDPADILQIQVSRDRLLDNRAYQGLVRVVRWALDFYAMEEARRAHHRAAHERDSAPLPTRLDELKDLVSSFQDEISPEAFDRIRAALDRVAQAGRASDQLLQSRSALLGTLASAGMAALALQHETDVHLGEIRRLIDGLQRRARGRSEIDRVSVRAALSDMQEHLHRIEQSTSVFGVFLDEEDRERRARLEAKPVVKQALGQLGVFLRNVPVAIEGLEENFILPEATMAEWVAMFQNILINAVNAMLDAPERRISIRSSSRGKRRAVIVEDTGVGVDVHTSERLFEPFVRDLDLSRERKQLGLGGTGLGLTIVRMIALDARSEVRFVEPSAGFSTALAIEWSD